MKPTKSVAPLVLGIIGGIFGILGGSCLALCGAAGGDFVKKGIEDFNKSNKLGIKVYVVEPYESYV